VTDLLVGETSGGLAAVLLEFFSEVTNLFAETSGGISACGPAGIFSSSDRGSY
jgi:hypothetical protein